MSRENFSEQHDRLYGQKHEVGPGEYHTRRFLETINRDLLEGIMKELLEKSGVAHRADDHVAVDVVYDPSQKISGWHSGGSVAINSAKFDFNDDYKKDYRRILSAFIHEYVHARAIGPSSKNATGFKYRTEDGTIRHAPINEGFTELIADYVYEEYMKRSGEIKRFGQVKHKRTVIGYLRERGDALELIKRIAQETGIPEDVVFGAYVRAYFSQDTDSFEEALRVAESPDPKTLP